MQLSWKKRNPSMEDFQTNKWDSLSEKERLRSLQFYENALAQEQGRDSRKVVPKSDGQMNGVAGQYDYKIPNEIYVNEKFLNNKDNSNNEWNSYNAMNAVAHEGRHAYQDDCLKGRVSVEACGMSFSQLEIWEKNDQAYASVDDNPFRFSKYRFQPLEDDAHSYAQNKLENMHDIYKNDAYYFQYVKNVRGINVEDAKTAEKYYGLNYRNEILNEIIDDYRMNRALNWNSKSSGMFVHDDMATPSSTKSVQGGYATTDKACLDLPTKSMTPRYEPSSLKDLDTKVKIANRSRDVDNRAADLGRNIDPVSKKGFEI